MTTDDLRAAQLAALATALISVPLAMHRTGEQIKPGDLVMEMTRRPADPDGIGWVLRIEGEQGSVAARYVVEPLGRPGVEQGWVNAGSSSPSRTASSPRCARPGRRPAVAEQTVTLADLVTATSRTPAELASATGGRISAHRWQQMATLPVTTGWVPDPPQLAAIATAIGQPVDVVQAAIAESTAAGSRG